MKTEMRWRTMLMALTVVALSGLAFSCNDDNNNDPGPAMRNNYRISGNAAGSQVVPSVTTDATGTITGTYNPNTKVLTYTNTWTNLSGAPTGGGFYNGAMGVNGTMVGSAWTYGGTATGTGTNSGTMTLTAAQEEQLMAGNWYYGYTTATNTNGEVRGQITATEIK